MSDDGCSVQPVGQPTVTCTAGVLQHAGSLVVDVVSDSEAVLESTNSALALFAPSGFDARQ